jgi:hypothetical protein
MFLEMQSETEESNFNRAICFWRCRARQKNRTSTGLSVSGDAERYRRIELQQGYLFLEM